MARNEITIQGFKINYLTEGRGASFLLLHGWGGSSKSLEKIGHLLAKKNLTVIIPDFPGFGESQPPKEIWQTTNFAQFIADFCQKLSLENFFLFGHSFGGRVALHFAANYPKKVRSLILCAPSGIFKKKATKISLFWWLAKLGRLLFTIPPLYFLQGSARRIFYFLVGERDYYQAKGIMKKIFKTVNKENILKILPKVKVKTLLIWGREDKVVPVKDAQVFHQRIRNSQLKLVAGGHDFPKKQPRKVAQMINEFIGSY